MYQVYQKDQDQISGATYIYDVVFIHYAQLGYALSNYNTFTIVENHLYILLQITKHAAENVGEPVFVEMGRNIRWVCHTVRDETENLNDIDSETFFGTKFF